ncbi:MAG: hypothetical protein ACE5G1_01175, partial [bacterium]
QDGSGGLKVNASSGAVKFGAMGQTTPLASLSVSGVKTLDLTGNIRVQGALDLNSVSNIVLANDITIKNVGGGDIKLAGGNIDGGFALTVESGGGSTTLGLIGQNVPLATVTVVSSGQTDLKGNIATSGAGGVDFNQASNVKLSNDVTIDTSSGNGAVKLNGGAVDGLFAFVVKAGTGEISLGEIGKNAPFAALTIQGGSIDQQANLNSQGEIALSSSGDITMSADAITTSNNNPINYTSTAGNVLIGELNAGSADVTVDTTGGGSIMNNQAEFLALNSGQTGPINIKGNNVTLRANDRIGESISDAVAVDIPGTIHLEFGAEEAFIRNIRASNVVVKGNGKVVNGLVESRVAKQKSESASQQTFSFEGDPELIQEAQLLMTVLSPGFGSATEMGQAGEITSLNPEVPNMVRTSGGWRFIRDDNGGAVNAGPKEDEQEKHLQKRKSREREKHDKEIDERFKEGFKYSIDPFSSKGR